MALVETLLWAKVEGQAGALELQVLPGHSPAQLCNLMREPVLADVAKDQFGNCNQLIPLGLSVPLIRRCWGGGAAAVQIW